MDDKDTDLHKQLKELHGEIERTDAADAKTRALLDDVKTDIGHLLERSQSGAVQPEAVTLERLDEAVATFEATHPTLTRMIAQLLDTLSNAGI